MIQTINSSLKWLTEVVRDRGDRLSAGQIILTGAIPSLIPMAEDSTVDDGRQAAAAQIMTSNSAIANKRSRDAHKWELLLKYGELDVLRDVQCDSIYVVDVNPTPYPLTHGIDPRDWSRAVQQMAVRFQEVFLS